METQIITLREIPITLWRQAKAAAATQGVTLQTWVVDAIREHLKQRPGAGK